MQVGRLLEPFYYNLTLFLLSTVKQLFFDFSFLVINGVKFHLSLDSLRHHHAPEKSIEE